MTTNTVLANLFDFDKGNKFYRVSNTSGKTWIIPTNNMTTAIQLYQPSGRNGILLKTMFPYLHPFLFVRNIFHAEEIRCEMKEEISQFVCNTFQKENIEYSIFCGTPSVHQKITVQISNHHKILGYCKFTDNPDIAQLFFHEERQLNRLRLSGITNIPHPLFCGQQSNNIWVFIQDTTKTTHSKTFHSWTPAHESFINDLYHNTKQHILFEETDFYKQLLLLMKQLSWLPDKLTKQIVTTTYKQLTNKWSGRDVSFSTYHADFTPWNVFFEKNNLFVFDWEYSGQTYPPFLDKYHFLTQTAIFKHHWGTKEIIQHIVNNPKLQIDTDSYKAYLLDIISRYTIREQGKIFGDVAHSMKQWTTLLDYLNTAKP